MSDDIEEYKYSISDPSWEWAGNDKITNAPKQMGQLIPHNGPLDSTAQEQKNKTTATDFFEPIQEGPTNKNKGNKRRVPIVKETNDKTCRS